jgi:hypothetical protein
VAGKSGEHDLLPQSFVAARSALVIMLFAVVRSCSPREWPGEGPAQKSSSDSLPPVAMVPMV